MRMFLNDMYVRSLAETDIAPLHQEVFGNLLKCKVDTTFNETVFGQQQFASGHMLSFSKGPVTQSLLYLDHSCIQLVPPYVIHKLDRLASRYLRESYLTFLPNVDPLEIPMFCCRYKVVQWWSQYLGKQNYSNNGDQIISVLGWR